MPDDFTLSADRPITIDRVRLDFTREPMKKAFGFKGAAFHEKWISEVHLTDTAARSASGHGGLAVLWSDEQIFRSHTETGGNIMMLAVLEKALQLSKGRSFVSPCAFLDELLPDVEALAEELTGAAHVRRTFVLNALVALDAAAWQLAAQARDVSDFDALVPAEFREALDHRHTTLDVIPLISYEVSPEEIRELVQHGHRILKIKIGAAGSEAEMLAKDKERLTQIATALRDIGTDPILYYLDANLRYSRLEAVAELLDHARSHAMEILLLEEPFAENSDISVHSLDTMVAADESLHSVADIHAKARLGYRAMALKPAGKTLSKTLQMSAEARRLGLHCFVADNACTPQLADINRNIAARLAPLPGLSNGLIEINGPQSYRNWDRLMKAHPFANASWMEIRNGQITLDESFYSQSGGWLPAPTNYE